MEDLSQHFHYRKTRQIGEEALGDWLYPNALYGGGCFADDRACIYIKERTEDSLKQVRTLYWGKCGFDDEPREGTSVCALEGDRPWIMFRSPYEGPSDEEGWLHLDITRSPHQSARWEEPVGTPEPSPR